MQKWNKEYKVYNKEKMINEVFVMNMNDPKTRRKVAIVALVIVIAMIATAVFPYLIV